MRILIVAISYYPMKIPSDKRFMYDLIEKLSKYKNIDITIWTLNESKSNELIINIGDKKVNYYSSNRVFHRPICDINTNIIPHPNHKLLYNLMELSISLLTYLFRDLKKIIDKHKPHIIHFMDYVGPIQNIIKKLYPKIIVTVSKPSVHTPSFKYYYFYKKLLKLSFINIDSIIAYSLSCKKYLYDAGIDSNKIKYIPWGVNIPSFKESSLIMALRNKFNCSKNEILVVGVNRALIKDSFLLFINEIKEKFANEPFKFVFSIRPTRFRKGLENLSNDKVFVVRSSDDFYSLLYAADVMIDPEVSNVSTCLPPLVWLEAMIRSTPIITIKGPGVEETILNGQNGIVTGSQFHLIKALLKFKDKSLISTLKKNAKSTVLTKYAISNIAKKYENFWSSLL